MEERAEVLAQLEGRETAISAGGSLSNTLLGLARLSAAGAARWGGAPLRVGMAGLVGSDPLGGFFSAQVAPGGTGGLRLVWAVRVPKGGCFALLVLAAVHPPSTAHHATAAADAPGGRGGCVTAACRRSDWHGGGADGTRCIPDHAVVPGHAR